MFIPAEMSEVDIFVYENDVEDIAQTVASLGVMHLLDANALGDWAEGVSSEWAGRIATYTAQERRVLEVLSQLKIREMPQPYQEHLRPAEDVARVEEALQQIESSTRELRERRDTLQRDLEHWELVAKSLEVLEPLSISLSDLRQMQNLHVVAGTIPAENLARLEASLFRIPYTIIPVHNHKRGMLVFAFCSEEHAPILDRALESAFLDPLALPSEYGGTPLEVLEQVNSHVTQDRSELQEIEKKQSEMAQTLETELQVLLVRIRGDRAIADAMAHFGHRGRVYLVAGWVPKTRVPELHAAIEKVTSGRATVEENSPYVTGGRQKIPTLLRNWRLFRPAEMLVTTYGTPDYGELDPTPLLAVTFVIMFGMMFGDLGDGLVLALVGLVLVLRLIPKLANLSAVGAIVMACGLASGVFGVLYGSVFGQDNIIAHLWLKPMRDIWALLEASIIFGVVVLNIGFAFRVATAIRLKRWKEAIFDKNGLVGLLLYWSLGGIVIYTLLGRSIPIVVDVAVPVFAIALFLAEPLTRLLEGKKPAFQGNIGEHMLQSFFELFEALISYISNTLSYVRLGAFAIAHAGLSMAIYLLANMVDTTTRIAVIGVVIIVVGNIGIILFEGLIVAIQTLRLEYYELFGKFFNGGGVPFKPLTLPVGSYQIASRKRSKQG
jgi:V/A-type H+/Na+-transporting ATPase subunit I